MTSPSKRVVFGVDVAQDQHYEHVGVVQCCGFEGELQPEHLWTEPSVIDINWKHWHDEALGHLGRKLSE